MMLSGFQVVLFLLHIFSIRGYKTISKQPDVPVTTHYLCLKFKVQLSWLHEGNSWQIEELDNANGNQRHQLPKRLEVTTEENQSQKKRLKISKCILASGRASLGQTRQNWNSLANHIMSVFTDVKMNHNSKAMSYFHSFIFSRFLFLITFLSFELLLVTIVGLICL